MWGGEKKKKDQGVSVKSQRKKENKSEEKRRIQRVKSSKRVPSHSPSTLTLFYSTRPTPHYFSPLISTLALLLPYPHPSLPLSYSITPLVRPHYHHPQSSSSLLTSPHPSSPSHSSSPSNPSWTIIALPHSSSAFLQPHPSLPLLTHLPTFPLLTHHHSSLLLIPPSHCPSCVLLPCLHLPSPFLSPRPLSQSRSLPLPLSFTARLEKPGTNNWT